VFVAHQPDVLAQGVDLFKDFAVVLEKSKARERPTTAVAQTRSST